MQLICKALGGSHSYGLNTPESDIDYRGVFLNTDYEEILGIQQESHVDDKSTDDVVYYELRRFVDLLRKGNTGALEILFNRNWEEVDPLFKKRFCDNAVRFVDSEQLYKCLSGYAQHELKLAMGLRPGVIGNKRANQVKQYGFSPKNFCQLFRLLLVGEHFFKTSNFVVNCRFLSYDVFNFLMTVKTKPEMYTIGVLQAHFDELNERLTKAFTDRKDNFKFDHDYANEMILRTYAPKLHNIFLSKIE